MPVEVWLGQTLIIDTEISNDLVFPIYVGELQEFELNFRIAGESRIFSFLLMDAPVSLDAARPGSVRHFAVDGQSKSWILANDDVEVVMPRGEARVGQMYSSYQRDGSWSQCIERETEDLRLIATFRFDPSGSKMRVRSSAPPPPVEFVFIDKNGSNVRTFPLSFAYVTAGWVAELTEPERLFPGDYVAIVAPPQFKVEQWIEGHCEAGWTFCKNSIIQIGTKRAAPSSRHIDVLDNLRDRSMAGGAPPGLAFVLSSLTVREQISCIGNWPVIEAILAMGWGGGAAPQANGLALARTPGPVLHAVHSLLRIVIESGNEKAAAAAVKQGVPALLRHGHLALASADRAELVGIAAAARSWKDSAVSTPSQLSRTLANDRVTKGWRAWDPLGWGVDWEGDGYHNYLWKLRKYVLDTEILGNAPCFYRLKIPPNEVSRHADVASKLARVGVLRNADKLFPNNSKAAKDLRAALKIHDAIWNKKDSFDPRLAHDAVKKCDAFRATVAENLGELSRIRSEFDVNDGQLVEMEKASQEFLDNITGEAADKLLFRFVELKCNPPSVVSEHIIILQWAIEYVESLRSKEREVIVQVHEWLKELLCSREVPLFPLAGTHSFSPSSSEGIAHLDVSGAMSHLRTNGAVVVFLRERGVSPLFRSGSLDERRDQILAALGRVRQGIATGLREALDEIDARKNDLLDGYALADLMTWANEAVSLLPWRDKEAQSTLEELEALFSSDRPDAKECLLRAYRVEELVHKVQSDAHIWTEARKGWHRNLDAFLPTSNAELLDAIELLVLHEIQETSESVAHEIDQIHENIESMRSIDGNAFPRGADGDLSVEPPAYVRDAFLAIMELDQRFKLRDAASRHLEQRVNAFMDCMSLGLSDESVGVLRQGGQVYRRHFPDALEGDVASWIRELRTVIDLRDRTMGSQLRSIGMAIPSLESVELRNILAQAHGHSEEMDKGRYDPSKLADVTTVFERLDHKLVEFNGRAGLAQTVEHAFLTRIGIILKDPSCLPSDLMPTREERMYLSSAIKWTDRLKDYLNSPSANGGVDHVSRVEAVICRLTCHGDLPSE
ncbi:hypothetical protein [Rhodospirillum sp. A1_3_36]|uniref:hypothetical protein n=1 Tax=Rhodospirillum sp. A1_3_36 TaxID=3391666 RepID=UPI0039A6B9F3